MARWGRANNNVDMQYNVDDTSGIINKPDVNFDVGRLDGVDKTLDTEHNASGADNTLDIDRANNTEKEAKVYKSNLF